MLRMVARDREHLNELIEEAMKTHGDDCDLNHIDVSQVQEMDELFQNRFFTGDISGWDVSNVTTMYCMFEDSGFNGDISKWNVGKVTDMRGMFTNSEFDGDISLWNVSGVTDMVRMFSHGAFKRDVSMWEPGKPLVVDDMFCENSEGLEAQRVAAWNIELFVTMDVLPADPYWRSLFQEMLPMATSLQLGTAAQAKLIWERHSGFLDQGAQVLPLPGLGESGDCPKHA